MQLSIFPRLFFGFLVLFILAMAAGIYAIVQLSHLENITHSILMIDNRLIDNEQKLSDTLLSMMRYDKKFIIMKDEGLYKQFLSAREDFSKMLTDAMYVADTSTIMSLLIGIKQNYEHYHSLVDKEAALLRDSPDYSGEEFSKEKTTALNKILEDLQKLRINGQLNTYNKVKQLNSSVTNAIKAAMIIGIASLVFAVIISTVITVNITKPLSVLKNKTREIAQGNFDQNLKISSPPEISELARSFNSMCVKLKEVDRIKSDFFSLMSHELRTPLTTIKEGTNLFLESMGEKQITEKQKRVLTIINEESKRLIELVNSLLELSKMESGLMIYNFSYADLNHLINKVSREIEPLAERRNIKIDKVLNRNLPKVNIDTERILQVLRNLVGNAVKFTPDNGVVRIHTEPVNRGVKVAIEDTGSGIAKDKLTAIFDKYYQETMISSNKIKGTGLGLSIVKHIIRAHGGEVWAESSLGHGSTFAFILQA